MRIILYYILILGVYVSNSTAFCYELVTHGAITQKTLERVTQADSQFLSRLGIAVFSDDVTEESGLVLEEGTDTTIEGAIVIARREGWISQLVDSQSVCYHVETANTDKSDRAMAKFHRNGDFTWYG